MVVTQHLRKEGTIVTDIRIKKKPDEYRACFRMPRDDTVDVAIVDADGEVVRVLAEAQELDGGPSGESDEGRETGPASPNPDKRTAHCFDWDGTDEAGALVPPGAYRVRLSLEDADRVAVSGERRRIGPGELPLRDPAS